uniref:Nidogen-1-like n=1 Tax=Gouania willdenowi TaxID=441366 RepID=A0A8C5HT66_GOUWI
MLSLSAVNQALELNELFEFGEEAGDVQLQPGTDSTAELELNSSLFLFSETFNRVYINTNGHVAVVQPPAEEEYLERKPSSFKYIAVLMGDLDNSDGKGKVYFRQDSSQYVLSRAAGHIQRAFPRDNGVDPTNTLVVTWENMIAQGMSGPDVKRNTFQLVLAFMESSSSAILLYPREGLQFISTSVQQENKLLEAGFNEGLVSGWFWEKQGTHYLATTDEESSIRDLTKKTNAGQNGVWVFEIGNSPRTSKQSPDQNQSRHNEPSERSYPEPSKPKSSDQTETKDHISIDSKAKYTAPEASEPRYSPVEPSYPKSDPIKPWYNNPERAQQVPPHLGQQHPQIVVVDEDEDLNVNVFAYNLETCALNRHKCSAFADCQDFNNGYCCQCRTGFYGNGIDCVAEGKPQRMNGKVNGQVFVGNLPSPVELINNDLHSYVVANDGRAYVAISNIPDTVGPSLQLLSSLGGVMGWAFALEQTGYQNGFSLIGGTFTRQAEVIFQPGNERLTIMQQFKGIDEHDHLVVSTELEGRLPAVPLGSSVQINPYKEIYHYDTNLITSSSVREYTITSPASDMDTRTYQWRQTITFQGCPYKNTMQTVPSTQQLSVDQIFVMFDTDNHLIRYAMSNRIGSIHSLPEQNPCFTGRHGCDNSAVCRPGEGFHFTCECSIGFTGDGNYCHDVDECQETPYVCGPNAVCTNHPGTFRCECATGFTFSSDGRTCIEENRPVDHCQGESHDCDIPERAVCSYTGGSDYVCYCRQGFVGDGRLCQDVDECQQDRCHHEADCINTQGSFTCQCHPGFHGDGFQCMNEKTQCELDRESAQATASPGTGLFTFFRPRPAVGTFVPQCNEHGAYEPTQCYTSIGQCWCVNAVGQEIPNTRTGPGSTPLCKCTTTPLPIGPTPRPDVNPVAPGTHLLFAQSGKIEHVPLDGYGMKNEEAAPLLHIPDRVVIAVTYDCVEKMIYWSDITGPAISKASFTGGEIISVVTKDLQSPEGIAVDHVARLLFWTDSMRDTIEVSKLDGSHRRVLFDTDLVNPRPIVTDPAHGRLYWADWNRDGPKIEMSNMDGTERSILVKDELGLPNGLTYNADNQQLCWADAGTRRVECIDPYRRLRITIIEGIQYPFALVSYGRNLYYTDWRREAVVAVDRFSEKETEEFLPQKRSRLYGITTTTTQCPKVFNYCSNNGGCSHLCLPHHGGFTCRCPDATESHCVEGIA